MTNRHGRMDFLLAALRFILVNNQACFKCYRFASLLKHAPWELERWLSG